MGCLHLTQALSGPDPLRGRNAPAILLRFPVRNRLGFSAKGLPEAGNRISLWLTSPAEKSRLFPNPYLLFPLSYPLYTIS